MGLIMMPLILKRRLLIPFLLLLLLAFLLWKGMIYPFLKGLDYFTDERLQRTRGIAGDLESPALSEGGGKGERRMNFLVLGIDDVAGTSRSDTIIVSSLDLKRGELWVLSIPRDTRVKVRDNGFDKAGHAYAYGGVEAVRTTITQLLGIPIDRYLLLDYKGFKRVVDIMGGVEIEVEERMFYEDKSAGFTIDLNPGLQRLNGEKALEYVRFRGDGDGDVGRIGRQLKFIRAAVQEWVKASLLWKAPSLFLALKGSIHSDLSFSEIMALAGFARGFKVDKMYATKLPGDARYIESVSFWIPDSERVRALTGKFFHGEGRRESPRIEVLNGNGIPGSARGVSELIKAKGFNVIGVGDAWNFDFEKTVIIDKVGERGLASELGRLLGAEVLVDYGGNIKYSDIVVIVGKDRVP